jgi:hypothetical protein
MTHMPRETELGVSYRSTADATGPTHSLHPFTNQVDSVQEFSKICCDPEIGPDRVKSQQNTNMQSRMDAASLHADIHRERKKAKKIPSRGSLCEKPNTQTNLQATSFFSERNLESAQQFKDDLEYFDNALIPQQDWDALFEMACAAALNALNEP